MKSTNAKTHLRALGVNVSAARALYVGDDSLELAQAARQRFYAGRPPAARCRDVGLHVVRVPKIFKVTDACVEDLGSGYALVGRRIRHDTISREDLYGCF